MEKEIAVILDNSGRSSVLTGPGTLVVFSRLPGGWKKERELPIVPDPAQGLKKMREQMAGVMGFLSPCRILVTRSASGAPYFELEKARFAIWEIEGKPEEFLDDVWNEEEKEQAKAHHPARAGEGSPVPVPQEKTPGTFVISIKEVQGKRPDISSKQVLQQFIQRGGFLVLDILCTHVPPWIEVEAERRGYMLETEQVDRETVKVRLTTAAGR